MPSWLPGTAGMAALFAAASCACSVADATTRDHAPGTAARSVAGQVGTTFLPTSVPQGSMVVGLAEPGARVEHSGRTLRVSPSGRFVFGVGRDATGPLSVRIIGHDGATQEHRVAVTPRAWPEERVNGVPPATVNPPPAIAERIRQEQARVTEARQRDDARDDFTQAFIWPAHGRVSGRFGNRRVYNGEPGAAHSGMDIAAPQGTVVKAPAAGVVTFADRGLYLTGGTLLLDHGHGISSNFLHLSRLDVNVGDRVEQGQAIGAVGATGRATGPHLHWGMNWFDVRIDPLLVLEASGASP